MAPKNRLRRDNIIRTIESLWLQPHRSRAELARELRLDRSTVGVLVDSLIERGIIQQYADDSSGPKGGRPPVLLKIVPGYAYSIGVELTYPHIRLTAVDLCGTSLGERDIPISEFGPNAINTLAVETARFRQELDVQFSKGAGLVTMGVGVSGQVDEKGRSILLSYALHIENALDVAEPLETVLNVPVILLNDAQAGVLREAGLRGKQSLLQTIVEIHPGTSEEGIGVGVGLVMGNTLVQGKAITHLLRPNHPNPLEDREKFLNELGRSLALVANVTGIDEVVLGGDLEDLLEPLGGFIDKYSKRSKNSKSSISVTRASGGSNAVALGAAFSALKFQFESLSFPL